MIRNLNPRLVKTVCIFALVFSGHAQSSGSTDYVELAKSRLAEMDETDMNQTWFYTMTAHIEDEILVSRNDPTKKEGERQELISVNGEPPFEKQRKEFKKFEDQDDGEEKDKLSDMIDLSTLALKEVINGQAVLSFRPVLEGLEEESDKLRGKLLMNTDTHLIEELSITNIDKISPAFSVSMATFMISFSFTPVDGEMLMSRMETSMEGKVGFLKKFKADSEMVFSDFSREPPALTQAGSEQ